MLIFEAIQSILFGNLGATDLVGEALLLDGSFSRADDIAFAFLQVSLDVQQIFAED